MGADEVPDALLGAGCQLEARLQAVVGLVGGDHQILLDGGAGHLPVGALPLVEGAHVGDHEAGAEDRLLDGVPDGVAGVVEHHGHPAARLEDAAVLLEAALHRVQIVGQRLALGAVDNRLRCGGGADAMPGLDQVVEVGVVDVLAEGRVGEYVVDSVVGDVERPAIAGGGRNGGAPVRAPRTPRSSAGACR